MVRQGNGAHREDDMGYVLLRIEEQKHRSVPAIFGELPRDPPRSRPARHPLERLVARERGCKRCTDVLDEIPESHGQVKRGRCPGRGSGT
jgi:hypothetical protein